MFVIHWLDAWEGEKNWLLKTWFLETSEAQKYVVESSLYQKDIGEKFTHFYRPSLCS